MARRPHPYITIPEKRTRKADRKYFETKLRTDHKRPQYRHECEFGPRPCPYVSCRYHLYLEVLENTGSIKINFPSVDIADMLETCALDVAAQGNHTLNEVGILLNTSRELVRKIEIRAQRTILYDGCCTEQLLQFLPEDQVDWSEDGEATLRDEDDEYNEIWDSGGYDPADGGGSDLGEEGDVEAGDGGAERPGEVLRPGDPSREYQEET